MPESLVGWNIFKKYKYRRGDFFPLQDLLTPVLFVPRESLVEVRNFCQISWYSGAIVGSFSLADWDRFDIGCGVLKLTEVYVIHGNGVCIPKNCGQSINLLRRV